MSLTEDDKQYIKQQFEEAADSARWSSGAVDRGNVDEIREIADDLERAEWNVSERLREIEQRDKPDYDGGDDG